MHYHAEVWIPHTEDVEKQVEEIMSSYKEEEDKDYTKLPFYWDWYQIGGRWKGVHVPDYDPDKDSANMVTGKTEWPTQWQPHSKDVIAVSEIPDTLTCAVFITPEGALANELKNPEWKTFAGSEPYYLPNPKFDGKIAQYLKNYGISVGYLVTVDYHS